MLSVPDGEGRNSEVAAHVDPGTDRLPKEDLSNGMESYVSLDRMQELRDSIAELLHRCVDFYVAFAVDTREPCLN